MIIRKTVQQQSQEKKEGRKDAVGERPAISFRLSQRRIDHRPSAGVIHQDHRHHRGAAEGIQRDHAIRGRSHSWRFLPESCYLPQYGIFSVPFARAQEESVKGKANSTIWSPCSIIPTSTVRRILSESTFLRNSLKGCIKRP